MSATKVYKFPRTIAGCLARLAKLKDVGDKIAADLKPYGDEEKALRDYLLDTFKKDELDGASGHGLQVSLTRSTVPTLTDWDAFNKFAKLKGNDDLLNRAVNAAAWRERLNAGKDMPGVTPFQQVGLRVSKKS